MKLQHVHFALAGTVEIHIVNLKDWADFGQILSGVGSVAAVFVVVWQLRRWRHERRSEKRSDAATEGLVSLHAACDACFDWAATISGEVATILGNPEFTHGETYERLESAFEDGRVEADRALRKTRLSQTRALPHLQSAELRSLGDVQSIARSIDLSFKDAMVSMRQQLTERQQAMEALQGSLKQVADRIEDVRKEGTAALTGAAQLEPPKRS